ncbi:ATP-binding protein [Singulisphaera sp. Ch08]|uniref:histidine kinase n=1 Tax=Singulisphaera sp. Ch08 TaxID=3120278 RepID=A0AAU7CFP4_9BACT
MPVSRCRTILVPEVIRRKLERLDGLPLRPATARLALNVFPEDSAEPSPELLASSRFAAVAESDPGWVVALTRSDATFQAIELLEQSPWWSLASGPAVEALNRLWRHSVAVGQAARRLATEAGEADVERIARAGLLHGLGLWAIAALEPEWFAELLGEPDGQRRQAMELQMLGTEASNLGRTLAERWGCDPLVVDAAWLHADQNGIMNAGSVEPRALALIQQAFALAERTPWGLYSTEAREIGGSEPRLRLLIAEVQVRCTPGLIEADATVHEERFARSTARLRRQMAQLRGEKAASDRFLQAFVDSDPAESADSWAERAALSWCGVAGVATARVVWTGPGTESGHEEDPRRAERPATRVLALASRGRPCAEIHLWLDPDRRAAEAEAEIAAPAWQAWAALVAERTQLSAKLESLARGHRGWVDKEEPRVRRAKLDALAEFAAGAGHELNNPLAVIVGRAQLLLTRATDPDMVRSLRAILGQAQRTHRIIRDLMFIGRTPESRPRFCQPDEVVRASLRDIKDEADTRGVRLILKGGEAGPKVWADPDALRHLADALIRNALEATREGDTIQIAVAGGLEEVSWSVKDNGRGITSAEGEHLFDPFFCGRQAGRGLGLGLPRAARIVQQAGGELRWHSMPGQGTIFQVHIPLLPPPKPPSPTVGGGEGEPAGGRNDPARA